LCMLGNMQIQKQFLKQPRLQQVHASAVTALELSADGSGLYSGCDAAAPKPDPGAPDEQPLKLLSAQVSARVQCPALNEPAVRAMSSTGWPRTGWKDSAQPAHGTACKHPPHQDRATAWHGAVVRRWSTVLHRSTDPLSDVTNAMRWRQPTWCCSRRVISVWRGADAASTGPTMTPLEVRCQAKTQ
jgi:hypothetical protein